MSFLEKVKSGELDPMTLPDYQKIQLVQAAIDQIDSNLNDLQEFLKEECPSVDPQYPIDAAKRAIIELKTEIKLLREGKIA